tara:strand:+ start:997 stop:1671 length:675 start_codon:yes stop_codon:yes gene_type:complete
MKFSTIAIAGLLCAGSASAFRPPAGVLSPLPRGSRAFAVLQSSGRSGFSAAERAAQRAAKAAAQQQNVAAPQAAQQPPAQAQAPPAQYAEQAQAPPAQYAEQAPAPAPAPATESLDAIGRPAVESVDDLLAVVLSEFVQSDYARECCNYCNIMPLDYGQVEGMFESLQRTDTKLVVKLKRNFEQRNVQLLDKLAKHLRARLPPGALQRMEYVVGSPPSTRTIII